MLSTPGKLQLVEAKRWSARERKAVGGHATSTTPDNGETRALLSFFLTLNLRPRFPPASPFKNKKHKKQQHLCENPDAKARRQSLQWQGIPELLLLLEGERERQQPPANTTAATTTLLSPLPSAPASRSSSASSPSRRPTSRSLDRPMRKGPEEDPGQDRGAGGGAGGGRAAAAAAAAAAVKARGLRPQPASPVEIQQQWGHEGRRRRTRKPQPLQQQQRQRQQKKRPRQRAAAATATLSASARRRQRPLAAAAAEPRSTVGRSNISSLPLRLRLHRSAPDAGGPTAALGDCAAEEAEDGRGGRRRRRGGGGRRVGPRARTRRLRGPGALPCCRCR